MRSDKARTIVLKSLISLSPYIENRVDEQSRLIELSGYLRSTASFDVLQKIAQRIEHPVGRLYEAVSLNRYNDTQLFSVSNLPDRYLGMSFICIAQVLRHKGELAPAFRLCLEAIKLSRRWEDSITTYQAQKELAILQSLQGNHNESLRLLENAWPYVRAIAKTRPALYYDYFNARAVELNEVGRTEEARINVEFALASPYAFAYPEWLETARDIATKQVRTSRNVVAVKGLILVGEVESNELAQLPTAPYGVSVDGQPAKPVNLLDWIMKTRGNKKESEKPQDDLTHREKQSQIINEILGADDNLLNEMLEWLKKRKPKESKNS